MTTATMARIKKNIIRMIAMTILRFVISKSFLCFFWGDGGLEREGKNQRPRSGCFERQMGGGRNRVRRVVRL